MYKALVPYFSGLGKELGGSVRAGEVQGQHSSQKHPQEGGPRGGSEGILWDPGTCQALGGVSEAGTAQPTAPKFQLFLILSETPRSRATIPPGLPRCPPEQTCHWPHGHLASQPALPALLLPGAGLSPLLLLIPRARALQEAPLHPMERE